MTKKDKRRFARMIKARVNQQTIAAEFGMNLKQVRELKDALGLTTYRPPMTDEQIRTAKSLYLTGASLREIGKVMGRPPSTVGHVIRYRTV